MELLERLYALNKKVIVVLSCGSAVEFDAVERADAIVHAYLGGQAGARALLNVLTGKVNPSGKLSESYPYSYEDCPSARYFPGKAATAEYREGPFVGYRYYTTAKVPVRYPFGYGLSYTSFEYSDFEVNENGAGFTLKNTGAADGAEIAQLYIGKADGKIFRPVRELKGFKKVFLKAGESARVEIPFDKRTFRYYNVKTNAWEEEGGRYEVSIGASSEDIRLRGEIQRTGTTETMPYEEDLLPSYYAGKTDDVGKKEFERLLGRKLPEAGYRFYKKNRMVIDENCTVADCFRARYGLPMRSSGKRATVRRPTRL